MTKIQVGFYAERNTRKEIVELSKILGISQSRVVEMLLKKIPLGQKKELLMGVGK